MTGTARCATNYPKFQCIGSACEDSCCIGWRVDLDRKTFQQYRESTHPALIKLIKTSVKRNHAGQDDQHFATITMSADGRCPFLDGENLCRIHRRLGAEALSPVCAAYPRRVNRVGMDLEYSLALSCPEAARQLLLDPTSMSWIDIPADPGLPGLRTGPQEAPAEPLDLRDLCRHILQSQHLELDVRLILVGRLLESVQALADNRPAVPGMLTGFARQLDDAAALEAMIADVESDPCLQLEFFGALVARLAASIASQKLVQCLIDATRGLSFSAAQGGEDDAIIENYLAAQAKLFAPFATEHPYVLENMLVHHLFHHAFPETTGNWLAYYRELCANYIMVKMMLLGQAVIQPPLTPAIAIRTIQSLSRLTAHHHDYPEKVRVACEENALNDVQSLFGLIAGAG